MGVFSNIAYGSNNTQSVTPQPKTNWLQKIFNVLNVGSFAVGGIAQKAKEGNIRQTILRNMWPAYGVYKGFQEKKLPSEVLEVEKRIPGWKGKVASIGTDILTDPLTYAGPGLIKGAGKVFKSSKIASQAERVRPNNLIQSLFSNMKKSKTPKVVGIETPDLSYAVKTDIEKAVPEITKIKNIPSVVPKSQKYAGSINLEKLGFKQKEISMAKEIEETTGNRMVKGQPLTNQEILKTARRSKPLDTVLDRDYIKQYTASLTKTRQLESAAVKEITKGNLLGAKKDTEEMFKNLQNLMKVHGSHAASWGRVGRALGIKVDERSYKDLIVKAVAKTNASAKKMASEAAKVDWNNANSVTKFYRKFVTPNLKEIADEFRYNNMLSNPLSHLRNAYSNTLQTALFRPLVKAYSEGPTSALKYSGGAIKSLPEAVSNFVKALKGETAILKPDMEHLPTHKLPGFMTIFSRAMEAGDRFFSTIISAGERASGKTAKQAGDIAEEALFRSPLGKKEQGYVLNQIDRVIGAVNTFANKAPGGRWFVPFIRTPMNIAKQWIEYSPAGFSTVFGASNKSEQIAKAFVGSKLTQVGAKMAMEGNVTWAVPTDQKAKDLFYASGKKPYSIKIGNKWIPMYYFGTGALAIALPAAFKFYQDESRTALSSSQIDKMANFVGDIVKFVASQTPLSGLSGYSQVISGNSDFSLPKEIGFTAGQIVPFTGFVSYVNKFLDNVYRKPNGFIESMMSNLPGLSQTLEPYTTPTGEPSKRELINQFLPYQVGTENEKFVPLYENRIRQLQVNAMKNALKKKLAKTQKVEMAKGKINIGSVLKNKFKSNMTQVKGASYTRQQDPVALIRKYFPASEWDNAYRVMLGESGGNPSAHNYNLSTGDNSYGLFQINILGDLAQGRPSADALLDPEENVKFAAQLWRSQGWKPWSAARKLGIR